MVNFPRVFFVVSIVVIVLLVVPIYHSDLHAQECKNLSREDCAKRIEELEGKLGEIRDEKNTLSSQIGYMDAQIELTEVRMSQTKASIKETEEEIEGLSGKIDGLNTSLDNLSRVLLGKIVDSYKRRRVSFLDVLLDADRATVVNTQLKYIRQAQESDRKVAFQMQRTKVNFEEQKTIRERKVQELDQLKSKLDGQKADLDNQKGAKQRLLAQTQNSEQVYQSLLARARAEYTAIQSIVSGGGNEVKLRDVKRGEMIASVIGGASCNSSGAHLHFIVQDGSSVVNPFGYLASISSENCSGSSCGSGDGDPFNPSGSWEWPLAGPIKFTQGFGETWAVRNTYIGRIYRFHNGIDVHSSSYSVKAVADGTLYRGSYALGCALPYMKLVHKDSNITTLYLHVQ